MKIMERKYDEIIKDTQKALDQILMCDIPKKTSPPKTTKPTSLGMGESSKSIEDSTKESKNDKQPKFFTSCVPISLDTSLDVNDPFQDNLDTVMIVEEKGQKEEEHKE